MNCTESEHWFEALSGPCACGRRLVRRDVTIAGKMENGGSWVSAHFCEPLGLAAMKVDEPVYWQHTDESREAAKRGTLEVYDADGRLVKREVKS